MAEKSTSVIPPWPLWLWFLQDVARQVLVLHDFCQHLAHIVGVDFDVLALFFWRLEADLIQYAFHDGVQAARANILRAFVHAEGEPGNFLQRLASEFQLHAFSLKQR